MTNLLASMGLDNVEADPNAIPDGKYDGVVFKSEYVLIKAKDQLSHVVTYKVTDGDRNGAQRAVWYNLGNNVKDSSGEFPTDVNDIVSFTPTMSEASKPWYKKMFVDLGIAEQDVSTTPIEALVGIPVTFGVKKKDGYTNVNFVERRDASNESVATGLASAPASLSGTEGSIASLL